MLVCGDAISRQIHQTTWKKQAVKFENVLIPWGSHPRALIIQESEVRRSFDGIDEVDNLFITIEITMQIAFTEHSLATSFLCQSQGQKWTCQL